MSLEGITEVMELGSQDFWCPQKNLMIALCKAFGRNEVNPVLLNTTNASQQPARLLYEALGIKYGCVDVDGRVGSVVMDLNFDEVPAAHKGKYGLVTNHTSVGLAGSRSGSGATIFTIGLGNWSKANCTQPRDGFVGSPRPPQLQAHIGCAQ